MKRKGGGDISDQVNSKWTVGGDIGNRDFFVVTGYETYTTHIKRHTSCEMTEDKNVLYFNLNILIMHKYQLCHKNNHISCK